MNYRNCALLFMVVLLTFSNMQSCFALFPSYTVDVIVSNPIWNSKIKVTFIIAGLGDFLEGTVKVETHAENLLADTFTLEGFYNGTDGRSYQWLDEYSVISHGLVRSVEYRFRGINCEWIDYTVCSRYSQYTSKIMLMGSVLLDTSAMQQGAYRINVMFSVRVVGHDFDFHGASDYEVSVPWQPWVSVTGLCLIIIVGVYVLLRGKITQSRRRVEQKT